MLLYRDPIDVVSSLMRRGMEFDLPALVDPIRALGSWQVHNRAVLRFYRARPNQCLLAHADSVVGDPRTFCRLVSDKLGIPLSEDAASVAVRDGALSQIVVPRSAWANFAAMAPEAAELLEQLNALADLRSESHESARRSDALESVADKPLEDALPLLIAKLHPPSALAAHRHLDRIHATRIHELERRASEDTRELEGLRSRAASLESLVKSQKDRLDETASTRKSSDELSRRNEKSSRGNDTRSASTKAPSSARGGGWKKSAPATVLSSSSSRARRPRSRRHELTSETWRSSSRSKKRRLCGSI